uniref:Uncharacterized protein n=1 Tax=Cacopsylla melanoneura TaxID=428564 RepID=A0A8D8QNF1_9HEMI
MHMIIPLSAAGLTLLLCILPAECAFNWDHLGGPPPESNEPIAYQTVPTKEPTPRYLRRIKEFLKRNRPRHAVEMLFPDNATALAEQHKEIRANMTKDPTWALRKLEELQREKGTSVCLIPDEMKNFTFPDMGVGTYDESKTDEKFNDYLDKCHLETDFEKLKAKYDPHDVWYNKSINWGEPTYDDEEFDKFVQKRIGRLLLGLYGILHPVYDSEDKRGIVRTEHTQSGISGIIPNKTVQFKSKVTDIVNTIDAITRDILNAFRNPKLQSKLGGDTNKLYKHYFLHNVLVETKTLKKLHLIPASFARLIKLIVKQFKHLNLTEIENVLENLAKNYESVFEVLNLLLANQREHQTPNENHMATSVEALFQNVLNPLVSSDTKDEVNVGTLEHLLKPIVEAYDHSVEINVKQDNKKGDTAQDNKLEDSLKERQEDPSEEELTTKISHVNQINNIINIYINNPSKHHKRRRSIVMETTTYLPPWDPKKESFPKLKVPGFSDEEPFNPLSFSFYGKRREAWEQYMKKKLGKPNNNSQSSFIFETWEYENPNKTRRSHAARLQNIAKIKEQGQIKKEMRKGNKTYEAQWAARREANMARQMNQTKQKQHGQHNKNAEKDKNSHKHHHKEHRHKVETKTSGDISELSQEDRKDAKKPEDKETTTVFNIQGITNLEEWFEEAEKYYTNVFEEEQKNNNKKQTKVTKTENTMTTRGKESRSKESIDSSYERYKKRKERRRKHKMSKRRYFSSEDRSKSSSCEHCNKRRRRKHRRYSSGESDYTESESSRRNKRRRRKHRYSSDSSDGSIRRRYHSSESKDDSISLSKANKKHKNKRSNEQITTPSTTTTARKSTTTKRKSTKKLDDAVDALDEPSAIISDVPSQELTSWHYWKDWSLFYFMHNISDFNFTTVNKWKTTWPWTTRKVRITKWRHPNVSWPPMSDSDSRSSQDSYEWGSGQSWIQNQKRELKSVEHFMRDNLFSEVNEGMDQLDKMDIHYSGNSADQDLELSENEDKMADVSARYREEYKRFKAEERERELEYQKWSLSGGNYSTTTEIPWEIKVTKNFTNLRSFRKGGHDIVFDISGLTLDPMSLEQIEKNLDADYLWKYGKNRTKTTTLPTTTPTTQPTTSTTTTTTSTPIATSTSNTPSTTVTDAPQEDDQKTPWFEEGKSMINSQFDQMTSIDREQHLKEFENNLDKYEPVGHHMFDNQDQPLRKRRNVEGNANLKKQPERNDNMKKETLIKQVLKNGMSLDDFYVQNKKEKMHFLHEVPQLSAAQIRHKELLLQSELNKCLQDNPKQNQQKNERVRSNIKIARRFKRGIGKRPKRAAPAEPAKKEEKKLDMKDFNQGKEPDHPIFILTNEDLENGKYKSYNATFINDKIHEYMDDMIDDLKINHDTSEEEKHANSIYYRKYLEKRTTEFFQRLREVLEGDNKRAIQDFTYPPNYDFDSVSVRDPKKEPYLAQLKEEYRKEHTKSFEELERDIALAKQGKFCTRQLRKEAEEHVRNLPDDEF